MMDIDHRCAKQQQDLRDRIYRIENILASYQHRRQRHCIRYQQLSEALDETVLKLHHMQRAHAKYDRAFQEALEDPTGQDLDSFDIGE